VDQVKLLAELIAVQSLLKVRLFRPPRLDGKCPNRLRKPTLSARMPIQFHPAQLLSRREVIIQCIRKHKTPAQSHGALPALDADGSGQSHAAPRTPLESPCAARTMGVLIASEKAWAATSSGRAV
jgi:hypothetical protein